MDAERLRERTFRKDIGAESLRGKCPQAIWFLSAAFDEMNHHLNAQKSNLTSHLRYKNIKGTQGFYRDLRRADY
jgi:hypothetical protein